MRSVMVLASLLPLLAAAPRAARAADIIARPSSPFQIQLQSDLEISFTGLLMMTVPEFLNPRWARPGSLLDPAGLNGLDRDVVGNHSRKAGLLSDGLLTASLSLPLLTHLIDQLVTRPPDGWAGFGKDSLVLVETFAVTAMVTNLVKFAVNRPRPFAYDPDTSPEERASTTASLSFFSGHSSLAFSMATAYSYLFSLRHPRSPLRVPVWFASHALAGTTAVMRVLAGKHFWSDVLIGAGVGSSIGFLVPHLHRKLTWRPRWWRRVPDLHVLPYFPEGGAGAAVGFSW